MPSFILIRRSVWPQYTMSETGQTGQWSDSIGRDIQSPTGEIKRGKKDKEEEETTAWKYIWPALPHGRGYFAECGLRNAESCQGVICGKSSAERSANCPLLLFRIPQPKNSAFPRMAKLPFARIAQQMCNWCISSRGPLKNEKNENGLLDIAAQCWIVHQTKH